MATMTQPERSDSRVEYGMPTAIGAESDGDAAMLATWLRYGHTRPRFSLAGLLPGGRDRDRQGSAESRERLRAARRHQQQLADRIDHSGRIFELREV